MSSHSMNRKKTKLDKLFLKINRQEAAKDQNGFCFFCTEPLSKKNISADHLKPKSKGGKDDKDNIKASCIACNITKGTLSAGIFKKYIRNPKDYEKYDNRRINLFMAWSRRKVWLQYHRSTKRMSKQFGMDIPQPN